MKRRRQLEITVETRRLLIHRRANRAPIRCLACSSPAEWITPEEAAELAGVSTRVVYRWVEAERLHFTETAEQAPLICLNSLLRSTDIRRT
jgi:excisionase family DNA binding protein